MSTSPIYQEPPPLVYQQQQPPQEVPVAQQAYTTHASHGSVGPVIGVMAVITILGIISVMIGRLCSGRRIMGHGQYDCEGWVEKKCSSCIDGRVEPPAPTRRPTLVRAAERRSSSGSSCSEEVAAAVAAPDEESREVKLEKTIGQQQGTSDSSHAS